MGCGIIRPALPDADPPPLRLGEPHHAWAVIEAGSQTAAARQLGRSLQSVNRSLAALERSVGIELVRRTTRQSFATEAGSAFYRRVKPFAEINEAPGWRHDLCPIAAQLTTQEMTMPYDAEASGRRCGAAVSRSPDEMPGRVLAARAMFVWPGRELPGGTTHHAERCRPKEAVALVIFLYRNYSRAGWTSHGRRRLTHGAK